MINLVLLGGSNSVIVNGLQAGLRQENTNLINLSLGGSSSLQNLYEILRNKNVLKNADLIISESNINDNYSLSDVSILDVKRNIRWYYERLYELNKKVLVIILPYVELLEKNEINEFHILCCNYFGFNIINMHEYYIKNNINVFANSLGGSHQLPIILKELAKNIVNKINDFKYPLKDIFFSKKLKFKICNEFDSLYSMELIKPKNSMFSERAFRLKYNNHLVFKTKFFNYKILAFHSWSSLEIDGLNNANVFLNLEIKNKNKKINIEIKSLFRIFKDIEDNFFIDKYTIVKFIINKSKGLDYIDIIDFLLVDDSDDVDYEMNYNSLNYFSYIIPPIILYKNIILEYCNLNNLKYIDDNMISNLHKEKEIMYKFILEKGFKNEYFKYKQNLEKLNYSAINRVKSSLPYKLGYIFLANYNKNIYAIVKLPFALYNVYKNHKLNNIKYNFSLRSCSDFKEAIKIKNSFSYKIGALIISAHKSRYKIGYIKLFYKLKKIKAEFKKISAS